MKNIKIVILAVGCLLMGIGIIIGFRPIVADNKDSKVTNNQLSNLTVAPLNKSGSAGNFASLKAGISLPEFPKQIMVYKVIKPSISEQQVADKAKLLGISGPIKESSIDFAVKSDNGEYIVDKNTGSFTYITKEFENQASPLKNVLSDEQYIKIATDFLNEKGLLHENAVFADVNRDNIYTGGDGTTGPYMIEVRFRSKNINGLEFAGVGPKIIVQFGENGRITGAFSVWREVEPYKEYPIITADEAIDKVKQGKAAIYGSDLNDSGTVNEISLSYENEPLGYEQEFVVPHYKLRGVTSSGKKFLAITRAIPDSLIQETPYIPENRPPAPPTSRLDKD